MRLEAVGADGNITVNVVGVNAAGVSCHIRPATAEVVVYDDCCSVIARVTARPPGSAARSSAATRGA